MHPPFLLMSAWVMVQWSFFEYQSERTTTNLWPITELLRVSLCSTSPFREPLCSAHCCVLAAPLSPLPSLLLNDISWVD